MNALYSLPVGRADCHVLLLESKDQSYCVVIDAGWYPPADKHVLKDFLLQHNIRKIDLLIITHLHMDHQAALAAITDTVTVEHAILPTALPISVTDAICQTQPGNKYLLSLKDYAGFFQWCLESGTKVEDIMTYAEGGCVCLGDAALRCLYPRRDTPLPSVDYALKMCSPDITADKCVAFENLSRRHANGDSSVWLLEIGGEQKALFMGDAPMSTIETPLAEGALHPTIVKLPHHGLSGGYFDLNDLVRLQPKELIVCSELPKASEAMTQCASMALSCGADIFFTACDTVIRRL